MNTSANTQSATSYDFLLVGAGLHNATYAHLARQHGRRCLVIDKRPQYGGNVFCDNVDGITVHKFGPHIFHTHDKDVWDFVNRFVRFHQFTLNTIANYNGRIYNLPFNMHTFYQMWGVTTPQAAYAHIDRQRREAGIVCPRNLEEQALSLVGQDVYETLVRGYTEKQWGRPCRELPPSIIKRLPVRFTYDNNYFNDTWQGIPEGGYNSLVEGLLDGVECRTNCNYFENRDYFDHLAHHIIFTGCIDEFFGYELGHLEYRSLRFEQETLPTNNYQGNAIVNYTSSQVPYTRIVEHKHFVPHDQSLLQMPITVITREYPSPYTSGSEPYYPINNSRNEKLAKQYRLLAQVQRPDVIFAGRLGSYRYVDMDTSIRLSMELAGRLL